MRSGPGFRMILHTEYIFIHHANAFYGIVIQVNVGHLYVFVLAHIFSTYPETVILRGDLVFAGNEIFNRVVATAMTDMHFVGTEAIHFGYDLVSKADTEDR